MKLYQYIFGKAEDHSLHGETNIYSTGKTVAERKLGRRHVWKKWTRSHFNSAFLRKAGNSCLY